MSRYNDYARKLESAFLEAREEFNKEYAKYLDDKAEFDRTRGIHATYGNDYARKLNAEARFKTTEADFERNNRRIWDEFNAKRKDLYRELEQEIEKNNVDINSIDVNALELIKTGILESADYYALAEKYDENPTMLRLIASKALEYAKTCDDGRERGELLALNSQIKSGKSSIIRNWNDISASIDYITNQVHRSTASNYEFTKAMCEKWEGLLGNAIENF